MTLGEKIATLRKESNYTQEQLADILGVSRQSVSKWESDVAYPETDKLIELGKIFNCSMDFLLKKEITDKIGNQMPRTKNKLTETVRSVVSGINKITLSRIISITIRIVFILITIDVITMIIYSTICGLLQ